MNVTKIKTSQCTGCLSCVYSCPVKCISVNEDAEGFLVGQVDPNKCLKCGKCLSCCPVVEEGDVNVPLASYAAQRIDKEAIQQSASGGIASVISEKILLNGGAVYGAIMDDDMVVRHHRVSSNADIDLLCGSKYVQSDFSDVYKFIKGDCENGKPVAVIGTPCQIFAIKKFLVKDYKNLLLIDLICHGTPSPALFAQYLEWKAIEMKDGPIIRFRFRDKELYGWDTVYKAQTAHKEKMNEATKDPYYFAFIYAHIYRESCYRCRFANKSRNGDITIGDFWGVEKEHPEFKNKMINGVSSVICSTEKGKQFFEELEGEIDFVKSTIEKISRKNTNLIKPAERPPIRDVFYIETRLQGFKWAKKKMLLDIRYYSEGIKRKIPDRLKIAIKKHMQ